MTSATSLRLLGALGRTPWKRARHLGAGLDLLDSAGPAYVLRRWREQTEFGGLGGALTRSLYREIWADAARELGAELSELPGGAIELRRDDARTRVWWHWVMLDDIVTTRLALDKPYVQTQLERASLPVPEFVELPYAEIAAAEPMLEDGRGPLVVKPASGTSGGGGVTGGIRRRSDLIRAGLRASRGDPRLLVERQSEGDMYRFLILDGELLDVVRRRPPRVTGDGRSSIGELITAENRRRLEGDGREGLALLLVDLDCTLTLERQGLRLSSRLSEGRTVCVKQATSQNARRDNESLGGRVAEGLVAEAVAAAGVVGLRLAGVDLITPDVSKPLAQSGGVILEVNGTPGLHYHYLVASPDQATRVAVPILRELLEDATG